MKLHQPVLLQETIDLLGLESGEVVVDLTAGYGGHSEAVLRAIGPKGKLYLNDQDRNAIEHLKDKFKATKNVVITQANFAQFDWDSVGQVDAILMDLGVSSPQLDVAERGFSFNKEARLDMRMDTKSTLDAYKIVNEYSKEELADIIYYNGEEHRARQIASTIVTARAHQPIQTTTELAEIIAQSYPLKPYRIHPATKTFQAIRIAVNEELSVLEQTLPLATSHLKPSGRLAVISFHSLEDRIVKKFFRSLTEAPKDPVTGRDLESPRFRLVNKKPIVPHQDDINLRARSAKLRIVEKIINTKTKGEAI